MAKAPDFNAIDADGRNFSIADFRGSPLVLHITNIEIPLCIECEKSLKGQVEELAKLKAMNPKVQIVTLNLRKNPYSEGGRALAEKWWKVNITWPWTEDIEPYPIGRKYLDYWNVRGGSSNPTILLIDMDGNIAGLYHVYRVGEGEIDGVQSAETLYGKLQDLNVSQWKGLDVDHIQPRCISYGDVLPWHPNLSCPLLHRLDDRGILLRPNHSQKGKISGKERFYLQGGVHDGDSLHPWHGHGLLRYGPVYLSSRRYLPRLADLRPHSRRHYDPSWHLPISSPWMRSLSLLPLECTGLPKMKFENQEKA